MAKIVTPIEDDLPKSNDEVLAWIAKQAIGSKDQFLLAHADDGAIWGKWLNGALLTSDKVGLSNPDSRTISPPLRGETLLQAFIFAETGEIRLFRNELGEWRACRINDSAVGENERINEYQVLWGDKTIKAFPQGGFTHLQDKTQQGLDQIIPDDFTFDEKQPDLRPRLLVRHFIDYDKNSGEARIWLSRLVKIEVNASAEGEIA